MNDLTAQGRFPSGEKPLDTLRRQCNAMTVQYNLTLSSEQLAFLFHHRRNLLRAFGRVEFGDRIVRMLIEEFCDSPFFEQQTFAESLAELLEVFYAFRDKSDDSLPDADLLSAMHYHFDTTCQGSAAYLGDMTLSALFRTERDNVFENEPDETKRLEQRDAQ